MRKTALASSSSGQPSQPKKPCLAPSNQVCLWCERNLVLRSFLTEEDVRRVELERAKSHPTEYCQSCTGNALEDVVRSLENAVQKLHRGQSSKKHDLPASDDVVWRLKMIAKDGKYHKKLSEAGIQKVGDFLLQLFTDPMKLKEILGMSSNSTNWDTLENHARSCKTNWKLYLYYPDGVRKPGAIFNTDLQLINLVKDRICWATHLLSANEKEHGDTIVKKAFDNWNDVMEFNGETFSCSMQKKSSSSFPSQVLQIENFTPIQCKLTPPICAAPVGPEAPLADVDSAAEFLGEQQWCHPVQENMPPLSLASQVGLKVPPESSASTVEGRNIQKVISAGMQEVPSVDENVEPFGLLCGSSSSFLAFDAGLPTQLQSLNSQNTMGNQIDSFIQVVPSANENGQPFGQQDGSPSSFLALNTEDGGIDWP